MIAKLQGGKTNVVIYGFCVPMDHLVKTTLIRQTIKYIVNGKTIGSMKSCSYKTFTVPSGYWDSHYAQFLALPTSMGHMTFEPGKTKYIHMKPTGYNYFDAVSVSKAQANKDIAEIKKIGQVF